MLISYNTKIQKTNKNKTVKIMTNSKQSIRINTDFEEIGNTISKMQDLYASLYSTRKYATQYLLKEVQKQFPMYTTRSIFELIRPVMPIKSKVRKGTYISNEDKDRELVKFLQQVIDNLNKKLN